MQSASLPCDRLLVIAGITQIPNKPTQHTVIEQLCATKSVTEFVYKDSGAQALSNRNR